MRTPHERPANRMPRSVGPPRPTRPAGNRSHCNRSHTTAFTLVEMLVSLAVLTVALSIVGAVFGLTTRAAGQSAAYAEVQGYLRQFAAQFDADLRGIDPTRSPLMLVGRTQAVALTQDDLDARKYYRIKLLDPASGSPFDPVYGEGDPYTLSSGAYANPRADLMMFFTNRAVPSAAPPLNPDPDDLFSVAAASGTPLGPVQVVYGHAAIGQAVWSGSQWQYPLDGDLRHIEKTVEGGGYDPRVLSALPGTRWRLARRQVIIEPNDAVGVTFSSSDTSLLNRIRRAEPTPDYPGDAAALNLTELLRQLGPTPVTGVSAVPAATLIPYGYSNTGGGGGGGGNVGPGQFPGWESAGAATLKSNLQNLVYPPAPNQAYYVHHFATLLENPPVDLQSNAAMQLVPGCVDFKIEFLMPEDARNCDRFLGTATGGTYLPRTSEIPNWIAVTPGQTFCFVPDSPENRRVIINQADDGLGRMERISGYSRFDEKPDKPEFNGANGYDTWHRDPREETARPPNFEQRRVAAIANRNVRLWPYAIRVTVRAIDGRGRLTEPVTRSFVHRFPD